VSALLVSDREREYTVGLLRRHLLEGRLTEDEFEERVGEAWRARFAADLWHALRWLPVEAPPAPVPSPRAGNGTALAALLLGATALALLVLSFGMAFPLTLPIALTAWGLGREARRSGIEEGRAAAVAGEALGIAVTVYSLLLFAGLAGLFAGLAALFL
jgi:uncharacterized protein DUF1707